MRRFAWSVAVLLVAAGLWAWASFAPPSPPAPRADSVTLPGMTLVEPGIRRVSAVRLEVRDGRIEAVREGASVEAGAEFAGGFVLPGLLDLHTHFPNDTPLALTEAFGLLYVAHGVTTAREAGDVDGTTYAAARRAYLEDGYVGPRPFSCGAFMAGGTPRWANTQVIEPGADVAALVRKHREAGYACVKVYDDLDRERVRALVEAARTEGLPAIGHVPFGLTLEEAALPDTQHLMGVAAPERIAAGDHVVHRIWDWSSVDDARLREVVEASVRLGLAHTPTLVSGHQLQWYGRFEEAGADPTLALLPRLFVDVAWHPRHGIPVYRDLDAATLALFRETLEKKIRLVGWLHEAGVPLRLGSDTQQPFVVPGASLWTEMRLFAEAGIPLEEIWADATWRAGEQIPLPLLGRLVPGAPADLLIFAEDPTQTLDALETLQAVVVAGRLYRAAELREQIEAFQRFHRRWLVEAASLRVARARLAATTQRAN